MESLLTNLEALIAINLSLGQQSSTTHASLERETEKLSGGHESYSVDPGVKISIFWSLKGSRSSGEAGFNRILAKMRGRLLETESITNPWEEQDWEDNPRLVELIAKAYSTLEGINNVKVILTRQDPNCGRSNGDIHYINFAGNEMPKDTGTRVRQMLARAISFCDVQVGESYDLTDPTIPRSERELLVNCEDGLDECLGKGAGNDQVCLDLALQALPILAVSSIGGPFLQWALLKSLHLEPYTYFDERVLHSCSFLASWIRTFEAHQTISLAFSLLSVMLNVVAIFTMAAVISIVRRTPILACCWLIVVFGGLSKSYIGFSTLEYFWVFLPFLIGVGTSAGILFHCYRQKRIARQRNYVWADEKDSAI